MYKHIDGGSTPQTSGHCAAHINLNKHVNLRGKKNHDKLRCSINKHRCRDLEAGTEHCESTKVGSG